MPGLPVLVNEHPEKPESDRGPGHDGGQETQQRLPQGDGRSIALLHPDSPGAHAEGLPPVGPKPCKKGEGEEKQVGREQRIVGLDRLAFGEG